jgi:hypothetical protein
MSIRSGNVTPHSGELLAMWSGVVATTALAGLGFWVLNSRLSPWKVVACFLLVHLVVLVLHSIPMNHVLAAQQSLSRSMTPALAEQSERWRDLVLLRRFLGGVGRALFFVPVPVAGWGVYQGVLWAIAPLVLWSLVALLALAALLGWLGMPTGILG